MGAPYPPVPNLLGVQIQGTIPGEIWENVLHFSYSGGPPSVSTVTSIASSIQQLWGLHVSPLQPNYVSQTQVIVTDMGSTTGAQGVSATANAGTRGTGEVPANAAVLVSYPAPGRFRGGHFRTYLLAGSSIDMDTPMHWNSAFQSLVSTDWAAFLNTVIGVNVGGNQIVSLIGLRRHGKYLPNAGPPNYVLTTPVQLLLSSTNMVVHGQIASQKGRIGRRSK